jgi:hypothetical protein
VSLIIRGGSCCGAISPQMAQSGHPNVLSECPLLGVKRTWRGCAFDVCYCPKTDIWLYGRLLRTGTFGPASLSRMWLESVLTFPAPFRSCGQTKIDAGSSWVEQSPVVDVSPFGF